MKISTQDFLRQFLTHGRIELRAIHPATKVVVQKFFSADELAQAAAFVKSHGTFNVYFGVAERGNANAGGLENCIAASALWCDLDFKRSSEKETRQRLAEFKLQPSAIINSGGGLHAYWILKKLFDLTTAEARGQFKSLLRRTAYALKGDLSSAEPAHILRIPGTLNHKTEYGSPRQVTVERWVM